MDKLKQKVTLNANGKEIAVLHFGGENDYISLTDIAKFKSDDSNDVIKNWMRSKDTILFLGLWEQLNNPDFKPVEFDGFKNEAGANAFTLSPQMKSFLRQFQIASFELIDLVGVHGFSVRNLLNIKTH
jgi:hypothetical protein